MEFLDEIEKQAYEKLSDEQKKKAVNIKKATEYIGQAISKIGSPFNIGNYMMSLALDREAPLDIEGVLELLAGDVLDEKLSGALKKSNEWLDGIPKEDVCITSIDGLKLIGRIAKAKKQKRVILAFHGWRSSWKKDFGLISQYWYDSGCTVLYVDQRAQGQSEGEYMGFGVYERFDCIDWAEWASRHFGKNTPIYLAGISMGASTVLMSSGQILPGNIKGIIADCGFTSLTEIWKHVAVDCLHIIYPENMLNRLCHQKIKINPEKHSTISALSKASVPVLFIHGMSDSFVPVEMTIENYNACASKKMIMLVPEAEHGLSYYYDKNRYEKTFEEFIQRCENE